jgi:hypothetical protein
MHLELIVKSGKEGLFAYPSRELTEHHRPFLIGDAIKI